MNKDKITNLSVMDDPDGIYDLVERNAFRDGLGFWSATGTYGKYRPTFKNFLQVWMQLVGRDDVAETVPESEGPATTAANLGPEKMSCLETSLKMQAMLEAVPNAARTITLPILSTLENIDHRIIPAGAAYTKDHRPERLNLHLDEKGRIEIVQCG